MITNVNTRKKKYYNVSRDATSVQRESNNQKDCKRRRICLRCIGRHHTSICERNEYSSRGQTNNDKRSDSIKSNKSKDSNGDGDQTQQPNASITGTNTVTSNNKVVLMQTATFVVNSK